MLAVVVLTFDPPEGALAACLDSVAAGGDVDLLVVVDNGRRAADVVANRELAVPFELLPTGRNLGYAGGMNVGIDHALAAGATMVALLNDDVWVEPGWLGPLCEALGEDERVGAAQPMLVFDTEPPTVNSLGVHLGVDGAGRDIGYGEPLPADSAPRSISVFTGGAVLLSAQFLRGVGGFDERYFLYYEDVDLALRGAETGWRYVCRPDSIVHHLGSATMQGRAEVAVFHRERNRLWVLVRHRPVGDLARGLWLSVRRLRHRPRRVHARALLAGLTALPRLRRERRRAQTR